MQKQGKTIGIIAAASSAILLGLTPILGKISLQLGFSPLFIVTFRSILATVLVFLFLFIFNRSFLRIYSLGLIGCILAGAVNGLGSILFYSALSLLDASIGQLLYSFYPLMVAFWLLLDRQTLTRLTIVRLSISIFGAVLLIGASAKGVSIQGAVMMLDTAALLRATLDHQPGRVLYKRQPQRSPLYVFPWRSHSVSFIWFSTGKFHRPRPICRPVIIFGVITALSRVLLFLGVKKIGGMETALLGLGELLVTVLAAQIFLGETLTGIQWFGAGLLLLSLILVGFDRLPPQKRRLKGLLSWLTPTEVKPTDLQ